jgi:uncharacterized CHY-type Zn-finger protein
VGGDASLAPNSVRGRPEHWFVAKRHLWNRAKALRRQGWPLRRIADELDVALSSVSVWVRDVEPAAPPADSAEPVQADVPPLDDGQRKTCGRCRETLALTAFNRSGDSHQHWCRECFRQYFRDRGRRHRVQSQEARLKRQKATYRVIADYLARSECAICGLADPEVLEFDHVGAKSANVSALAYESYSAKRVAAEIAQCQVVCVNCHRRLTAEGFQTWRHADLNLASTALARGERRNLLWIRDLLRRSACADCKVNDFGVLEFDHVGVKTENISRLARNGVSLKRLQAEVDECEIVCANCHRKGTRQRKRELHDNEPRWSDAA